jgi:NADH-quinone oxidoreductase subunit K
MTGIDPVWVQLLAVTLFVLGIGIAVTRRNIFFVLMGVEVAINAVNLSFIGFARTFSGAASLTGQIVPLFTIAVAAAEACIGLAIVILIFRGQESRDSDDYSGMKE